VHRLLREDPRLPGKRVRELLEEQGYAGGKTIVDDYLREVRVGFVNSVMWICRESCSLRGQIIARVLSARASRFENADATIAAIRCPVRPGDQAGCARVFERLRSGCSRTA
jgi:hypothetical protein